MKKLMSFSFLVLMVYVSGIAFINYGYSAMQTIEGNKTQITIRLPEGEADASFLSNIEQKMTELNADIMIRYVDGLNGRMHHKYYLINNSKRFIEVVGSRDPLVIKDNDCYSTTNQSSCNYKPLKVPSNLQEISLYPWGKASFNNINEVTAFIDAGNAQEVTQEINKLGYEVSIFSGVSLLMELDPKLFLFVPSFMFIMSIMFYMFSIGKNNVLRKYEGFNVMQIIKDELVKTLPTLLVISLVVVAITMFAGLLSFQRSFTQFLLFYIRYQLVVIAILLTGILIAGFLIWTQSSAEHIKGKAPKKGIYYTTMFGKIVFLIFFLYSLSLGIRFIQSINQNTKTARMIQEKVEHFVTVPIYGNNASPEGMEQNYLEFYKLTVEDLNGILIEAGNYRQDEMTGLTPSEEYDQPYITINDNYLKFNPIFTNTGISIDPSLFDKGKQYVLIPSTRIDEKAKYEELISTWYSKPIEFIEYDGKASEIYSYNPGIGSDALGRIDQPIIFIFDIDSKDAGAFIRGYVSTGSYLLQVSTQNPYEELHPYIDQAGIGSVSPATPYVIEGFREFVSFQQSNLRLFLSQSVLFSVGILSLIVFSTQLFFENNNRQIACSLIEGSTLFEVMRRHLFLSLISYLLIIGLMFVAKRVTSVTVNQYLLLVVLTAEVLITILIAKTYAAHNISLIMKGEE